MRFAELSLLMRNRGAKVLFFPSSFNATTGPLHYELCARARALDNQCFVVVSSPARDFEDKDGYPTWGHSIVVNPNGLVVAQAELREAIVHYEIDLEDIAFHRRGLDYEHQKRNDVYKLVDLTGK